MKKTISRLPDSELDIMLVLWNHEPPMGRLEIERVVNEKKKLAPTTILSLLTRLEKKGFVTCRTSEKDHRCKVVSATERAHELHHAIGVFDDRVFTALCRGLSEGEVAEFLRITDVMLENAKNMNDAREPFPCGRGCDAE